MNFMRRMISYPEQSLRQEVVLRTEAVFLRTDLLFVCEQMPKLRIGVNCENLWTPDPPRISMHWRGVCSGEIVGFE